MSDNVVSLKAHRTLVECRRLFRGYEARIMKMDRGLLLTEVQRYKNEAVNYPHHLLTIVKGEILMGVVKNIAVTPELKEFSAREEVRLKQEVRRRLTELERK